VRDPLALNGVTYHLITVYCLSNAMHGQNISLSACVCLSVCPSHLLSTRLQVRPLNGFLQLIYSLKDADLRKDVPFWRVHDEYLHLGVQSPPKPRFWGPE